jgi:hypothetical protein
MKQDQISYTTLHKKRHKTLSSAFGQKPLVHVYQALSHRRKPIAGKLQEAFCDKLLLHVIISLLILL